MIEPRPYQMDRVNKIYWQKHHGVVVKLGLRKIEARKMIIASRQVVNKMGGRRRMEKNVKKADVAEKPADKTKVVTVPLNDSEKALIAKWQEGEAKTDVPFKIVADVSESATKYEMMSKSKRGNDEEKDNLVPAGLCAATGCQNSSMALRMFNSCASASGFLSNAKPKEVVGHYNVIAESLNSMKPQDEFEGMLITQMLALHFQFMHYLTLAAINDMSPEVRDSNVNRSTKLGRLFNEKLEALQRYRRKGEQKVVVQHVNVGQGGQAIVGNVQTGGGGVGKTLGG